MGKQQTRKHATTETDDFDFEKELAEMQVEHIDDIDDMDVMDEKLADPLADESRDTDISSAYESPGASSDEEKIIHLIQQDYLDNKIENVAIKGRYGQTECTVSQCTVKDKLQLTTDKLRLVQKERLELSKEKEVLKSKLENVLKKKLKPEEYKKIAKSILLTEEVKQNDLLISQQKKRIAQLTRLLKGVVREFEAYKEETSKVKTRFEADKEIQEQLKYLKKLEEKRDKFLMLNDELDRQNKKLVIFNDKLTEVYNQNVRKLNKLRDEIKDMELIHQKGMVFKLKSPRGLKEPAKRSFLRWSRRK